jgi:hypothetical protein
MTMRWLFEIRIRATAAPFRSQNRFPPAAKRFMVPDWSGDGISRIIK